MRRVVYHLRPYVLKVLGAYIERIEKAENLSRFRRLFCWRPNNQRLLLANFLRTTKLNHFEPAGSVDILASAERLSHSFVSPWDWTSRNTSISGSPTGVRKIWYPD